MIDRIKQIPVQFLNREAIAFALLADTLRDVNGLNTEQITTLSRLLK
jgi:hypothetical protein